MTTIYTRHALKTGIAAAILAVSIPALCSAQDKGPAWLRFQTATIKPEMRQEYEGYMKQVAAANKKAGVSLFVVYQNFAGNLNEYTSVQGIMKFAEMDGTSPLVKSLGEEGSANLLRNLARCTTSQTRYFSLPNDGLAINKGSLGTLFIQNRTQVAAGKMQDYENWLKNDYKPALEKAGVTVFRVSRPVFGVASNQIETLRMMKDFAEIDGGPILNQKLGADAVRALNAKSNGLVVSSRTTIIRVRPDLSILPPAATATN
jgi:hypothetical protein